MMFSFYQEGPVCPVCRRYPFLLLLLGVMLGGCVTWRPYDATLSDGQRLPSYIRATRQDSSQVSFTDPFVRGDTLYGRARADSVGVPVSEIAGLEREKVSVERTLGAVVVAPAAVLGVLYLVVCSDDRCSPTY
jgi:hypothetical protein